MSELRCLEGIQGGVEEGDDVGIIILKPVTEVGGFCWGEEPTRCSVVIEFRRICWLQLAIVTVATMCYERKHVQRLNAAFLNIVAASLGLSFIRKKRPLI